MQHEMRVFMCGHAKLVRAQRRHHNVIPRGCANKISVCRRLQPERRILFCRLETNDSYWPLAVQIVRSQACCLDEKSTQLLKPAKGCSPVALARLRKHLKMRTPDRCPFCSGSIALKRKIDRQDDGHE